MTKRFTLGCLYAAFKALSAKAIAAGTTLFGSRSKDTIDAVCMILDTPEREILLSAPVADKKG